MLKVIIFLRKLVYGIILFLQGAILSIIGICIDLIGVITGWLGLTIISCVLNKTVIAFVEGGTASLNKIKTLVPSE